MVLPKASFSVEKYRLWRYGMALESMMVETTRFCEISKENFHSYSEEYAKIIILASIHFETCAKEILKIQGINCDDMGCIRREIMKMRPKIASIELSLFSTGISIRPLSNWQDGKAADFWKTYTNLKHSFHENMNQANQKTALVALGSGLIANK